MIYWNDADIKLDTQHLQINKRKNPTFKSADVSFKEYEGNTKSTFEKMRTIEHLILIHLTDSGTNAQNNELLLATYTRCSVSCSVTHPLSH